MAVIIPPPAEQATSTAGTTFRINSNKVYLLVINLSINDKFKFLGHLKQRLYRTIS